MILFEIELQSKYTQKHHLQVGTREPCVIALEQTNTCYMCCIGYGVTSFQLAIPYLISYIGIYIYEQYKT